MTSKQNETAPSVEPLSPPERPNCLRDRHIILAITGSIAAYKAVALFRLLQKEGAKVEVILTEAGSRFVGASAFSGFGAKVHQDMFAGTGELHVDLGKHADALVIAPATADALARLRQGRANDLLTATALCTQAPVVLVPAMHPEMWSDPAVQENVRVLAERKFEFIGPVAGEVASGDVGTGRMSEPEAVLSSLAQMLLARKDFMGRHIVVTAGPTQEPLDPVRSLTNSSSGKMGFAIAAAAARRSARVTLISGPVSLPTPRGIDRVDVRSALEMREALWSALGDDLGRADALFMSAAVADYRPRQASDQKLKRSAQPLTLELVPNPDLLAELGATRRGPEPLLVGFALETGNDEELTDSARDKLRRKRVDLVVANTAGDSLGRDDNRVLLVTEKDAVTLPRLTKERIASHLLDWLLARFTADASLEVNP